MATPVSIAAAQMTVCDRWEDNLNTCHALAKDAAKQQASAILLPENFAFFAQNLDKRLAMSEALDASTIGPVQQALKHIAQDTGLWIIAGGMRERHPTEQHAIPQKTYNTCVVLSPQGQLVQTYRKVHLFDLDIPNKVSFKESSTTLPGNQSAVVDLPFGRIGLSICYDLRFPEYYRQLSREGAQIILVPASFSAHTGAAHWHTLLRARAIENQCYVVAAAQTGYIDESMETYGHSLIVDPWGEIIAEKKEGVGIVTATIDLEHLNTVRTNMPCLEHRVF